MKYDRHRLLAVDRRSGGQPTIGPQSAKADHEGIAQNIATDGNVEASHTVSNVIYGLNISAGRDVSGVGCDLVIKNYLESPQGADSLADLRAEANRPALISLAKLEKYGSHRGMEEQLTLLPDDIWPVTDATAYSLSGGILTSKAEDTLGGEPQAKLASRVHLSGPGLLLLWLVRLSVTREIAPSGLAFRSRQGSSRLAWRERCRWTSIWRNW